MMEIRNAAWNRFGTLDCEVNHPQFGWVPYTANPDDRPDIYDAALALDPAPYVEPQPDPVALCAAARAERNRLLAECDWTQVQDAPTDKAAWAAYRDALRDVPQQAGFPVVIDWPTAP